MIEGHEEERKLNADFPNETEFLEEMRALQRFD
jgi:hypothetical protein